MKLVEAADDMDIDDLTAVLNSDSEIVLSKGLRRFASQIRREHGLLPPLPRAESAGSAASADAMEIVEGADGGEREEGGDDRTRGDGNENEEAHVSSASKGHTRDGAEEEDVVVKRYKAALIASAAGGTAPGLLGEYLRGSPQLSDLLAVWDLEARKSSSSLVAVHTDAMAAVLECLHVVLRAPPVAAGGHAPLGGVGVGAVEATGLAFCRRLIREKLDRTHSQLFAPAAAGSTGKRKSSKTGPAATLRLLTGVARFHRLAAKELAGVFNFTHKAFVKMISHRGSAPADASAANLTGGGRDNGVALGDDIDKVKGKGAKKRRKGEAMAVPNAAAGASAEVAVGEPAGPTGQGDDDTRHLSVLFLCSFMESEDPSLQTQMVSGARGGGTLGLIFRGSLWRDSPATALMVVETLDRHLLRTRRISRRCKVDFFSSANIEHLRKVFDDAPPRLYEALYALMSALLVDPTTSPFLAEPNTAAGGQKNASTAIITSPRPLLAGLTCLGAHEDLRQRMLVLSALRACPALVGPYLRSFPAVVLQARPSYHLLQTYSLLSVTLREAPTPTLGGEGSPTAAAASGAKRGGSDGLLAVVMPMSLDKKELTKGVLSGNPLLQAATMTLIADILDRSSRVARASAATGGRDVVALVRQRLPEVQTLLGLRDKIGKTDGSTSLLSSGGEACLMRVEGDARKNKKVDERPPTPAIVVYGLPGDARSTATAAGELGKESAQADNKSVFLRWRLISLLDLYAKVTPEVVIAARFDFLKLLPVSTEDKSPSASRDGLGSLHPLVQLATLRLLARPAVAIATSSGYGAGGGSAGRSGWLADRVAGSQPAGGGGKGSDPANELLDEQTADTTPLGTVLRTALTSTSPSIRAASRGLAAGALRTLGIITATSATRSQNTTTDGGGQGSGDGGFADSAANEWGGEDEVDGEAGVWLDLLHLYPQAVGSLVLLARKACGDAQGLLAMGIRAAEQGTRGCPFLHGAGGSSGIEGDTQQGAGDWEVEFSPLAVAAVATLASTGGGLPAHGRGQGGSRAGKFFVGVEAARFFSGAISRLLYLHDDPRPFAGLCLSLFAEVENDNTPGGKACEGLKVSISRAFGADSYKGATDPNEGALSTPGGAIAESLAAAVTLTGPNEKIACSGAGVQLADVLADNAGINLFALDPVRSALAQASSSAVRAKVTRGDSGRGCVNADDDTSGRLAAWLLLPYIPLPRLLCDALTPLDRDPGSPTLPSSRKKAEGAPVLASGYDTSGSFHLPAASDAVFDALAGRIESESPRQVAVAVKQIVSLVGMRFHAAAATTAAAGHKYLRSAGSPPRDTRSEPSFSEPTEGMLSAGIRLASRACLDLVIAAATALDAPRSLPDASPIFDALSVIFRNPLLLNLACPLRTATVKPQQPRTATQSNDSVVGPIGNRDRRSGGVCANPCSSVGAVACAGMSALLRTAASAGEPDRDFEGKTGRDERTRWIAHVVCEAAAVFVDRLCGSTAIAVASGSSALRWLSPSLIACRGRCSGDGVSRVLASLLKRLTAEGSSTSAGGEHTSEQDSLARCLLERLLAPQRIASGIVTWTPGNGGGERALVQHLDPSSMAALLRLQVKSGSPGLARLLCLALTGSSARDSATSGNAMASDKVVEAAASAGFLDDEAFFQHFSTRLIDRSGDENGTASPVDDTVGGEAEARILEQLVLWCPVHAHRLARVLPPILLSLPPVSGADAGERGGDDGGRLRRGEHMRATRSLLALRRPLQAFLSVGIVAIVSPPLTGIAHGVSGNSGGDTNNVVGGGNRSHREGIADDEHIDEDAEVTMEAEKLSLNVLQAFLRESSSQRSPLSLCYPHLGELLPRCVVPLIDASLTRSSNRTGAALELELGSLLCLKAVLGVCGREEPGLAAVVAAALRRSMAECERSAKNAPAAASHAHTLARAELYTWLTSPTRGSWLVQEREHGDGLGDSFREDLAKEYLRHCLARAAAVAKAIGRAARRKSAAAKAAAPNTETNGAEGHFRFLLNEVQTLLKVDAALSDRSAVETATRSERVARERLVGHCRAERRLPPSERSGGTECADSRSVDGESKGTTKTEGGGPKLCEVADEERAVIGAFLTAILKHRLVEAESLRAARIVASVMYQEQAADSSGPNFAGARVAGDTGMAGEHVSTDGTNDWGYEDCDGTTAAVRTMAASPAVVPEWSATKMLERVVGHSNFLAVIDDGGSPARTELLRLLVLLASAGGAITRGMDGRGLIPLASGAALLRPLLAVYGASLSEDDQLIVRLLRLLQASGVSLDPNMCRWGPGARDAAAAALAIPTAAGSTSSSQHLWQWLLGALETRRLRASVEAFPIERGLEPPSFGFEARGRDSNRGGNTGDAGGTTTATTRKSGRKQNQRQKKKRGESSELGDEGGRHYTIADLSSRYHGSGHSVSNKASGNEDGPEDGRGDRGHDKMEHSEDDGDTGGTGEEDSDDSSSEGISDENFKEGSEDRSGISSDDETGLASDGDDHDGPDPELELGQPLAGMEASAAMKAAAIGASTARSAEVYDPCFVLPLAEWGLRVAGAPAQAICESPLLAYIITATSSISLSARASAYSCLSHLLESLEGDPSAPGSAATNAANGGAGIRTGKARRAAEAAFRQRPQLALLLRCLRDGVERPLQRVPCLLATALARAAEMLASSPGSEIYKAVNSFLLHRPYIRLGELPLFDTLFTGVQQGSGKGMGSGLGGEGSDPVAAGKGRMWILRALRDGLRTSQDLAMASSKRVVPLLLALADSPVGDGDTAIQGIVLDILCRVASLHRYGSRYLLEKVGLVAWCRVTLGRGLPILSELSLCSPASGKASDQQNYSHEAVGTDDSLEHGPVATAASSSGRNTPAALPVPLQVQMLLLLRSLVRSGRRLPNPPTLLEEELALLAPHIVRCLSAAAVARLDPAEAVVGPSGKTPARIQRQAGVHDSFSGLPEKVELISKSVALLEELQLNPAPGNGHLCGGAGSAVCAVFSVECSSGGGGMNLGLPEALALSHAVSAVRMSARRFPSTFVSEELDCRVVKLLASAGALRTVSQDGTSEKAHLAIALATWALKVAHNAVRAEALVLTNSIAVRSQAAARAPLGEGLTTPAVTPETLKQPPAAAAVDVALGAVTLLRTLLVQFGAGHHEDQSMIEFRCSTAASALALEGAAARLTKRACSQAASAVGDMIDSSASTSRAAVANAVLLLSKSNAYARNASLGNVESGKNVREPTMVLSRSPSSLATAMSTVLRRSKLLQPLFSNSGARPPDSKSLAGASEMSGAGNVGALGAIGLDWGVRTTATLLTAAIASPQSMEGAARASGLLSTGNAEMRQYESGYDLDDTTDKSLLRTTTACTQALEAVPPGLEGEPIVVEFVHDVRVLLRQVLDGHEGDIPVSHSETRINSSATHFADKNAMRSRDVVGSVVHKHARARDSSDKSQTRESPSSTSKKTKRKRGENYSRTIDAAALETQPPP